MVPLKCTLEVAVAAGHGTATESITMLNIVLGKKSLECHSRICPQGDHFPDPGHAVTYENGGPIYCILSHMELPLSFLPSLPR